MLQREQERHGKERATRGGERGGRRIGEGVCTKEDREGATERKAGGRGERCKIERDKLESGVRERERDRGTATINTPSA